MQIPNADTHGLLTLTNREMLTVAEIARALSVHPDTIRRWEKRGMIRCVRHPFNDYRLFKLSEILRETRKDG